MTIGQSDERPEPNEAKGGGAGGSPPSAEPSASEMEDLDRLTAEELREKLRKARADAQRNWQHFLHSAADLENYKKQAARERQDAVERTRRQMLMLVLGVLDNLERAMAYGDGQSDGATGAVIEGLRIMHRQILDQLRAIGVRPIEVAGKPFDPRMHEAIGVVPPKRPEQAGGTIADEVLRGYLLNDDVLRPARVTVVAERPGRNGSPA
jgi:molecular chaperone GrpE